jgi:putative ATPase
MSLFEFESSHRGAPLAVRMRPRSLDEVVGHASAVGAGSPLRRLIESPDANVSVILWGPPGSGKTTLAHLVSRSLGREFVELSAVNAGVKDVRTVIDGAKDRLVMHDRGTVVFIDEVHRFSKTQQDALLPAVENGWITLIAATTENPSFSVVAPLLSRSVLVTLDGLSDSDVSTLIDRACADQRGLAGRIELAPGARDVLVRFSGGDARRALTSLEACASGRTDGDLITDTDVETTLQSASIRYDRDGDQHYDVISAFIKSVRGSDPDAALHYLARMIAAGEDPRFIARRLMILASEDIGLADPSVLPVTVAAAQSVAMVGWPEARIILAQVTIHAALAPKSNSVVKAIDGALADVRRGGTGSVPAHLRDAHYPGARTLGHGAGYVYPHDLPEGVAAQTYLPDELSDARYYEPSAHGAESRWGEVLERVKKLRGGPHQ